MNNNIHGQYARTEQHVRTEHCTRTERYTRTYVKVTSVFDSMGFMTPREVIWTDGRIFPIESVRDFRPASAIDSSLHGDCFTVVIGGKEKHLFFERTDSRQPCRFGRWFVEIAQ